MKSSFGGAPSTRYIGAQGWWKLELNLSTRKDFLILRGGQGLGEGEAFRSEKGGAGREVSGECMYSYIPMPMCHIVPMHGWCMHAWGACAPRLWVCVCAAGDRAGRADGVGGGVGSCPKSKLSVCLSVCAACICGIENEIMR